VPAGDAAADGTVAPSPKTEDAENEGRPVTLEELARHSKGVIALASLLRRTKLPPARMQRITPLPRVPSKIKNLKGILGDRLYLAVQRLSPGDGRWFREAERLGCDLNIPLVATNNVHFIRPEEHLHHRAVNAVRVGGCSRRSAHRSLKNRAKRKSLLPRHGSSRMEK